MAVAGVNPKDARPLCEGDPPLLPTTGASAPVFALAALGARSEPGLLLAVEEATLAAVDVTPGAVSVRRDERPPQPLPRTVVTSGAELPISLPAYERAFDAKLRLEARRCVQCGVLAYPPRVRCLGCGSEAATEPSALPRDVTVYSTVTVRIPVPGLATPYSLAVVDLGETDVRVLVHVTGSPAGSVGIGDRGRMVMRKVADRSGVPDYGYGFLPDSGSATGDAA